MGIGAIIKKIMPKAVKSYIRSEILRVLRENKAPQMIYGYQDPVTGEMLPRTRISDSTVIYNPENVKFANNVFVGHYAILDGTEPVTIGEGTQIGHWVGLFTHSSHNAIRLYGKHYSEIPESDKKCYQRGGITFGRYVFTGSGSMIFPGVTIGDGAIISAGSLVKKDVEPFTIVSGDSNKVIGNTKKLDKFNLNIAKDQQLKQWYEEWQQSND